MIATTISAKQKNLKKLSLVFMASVAATAAMLLWLGKRLTVSEYG